MKNRAAIAAIVTVAAVGALAACTPGGGETPPAAEGSAQAWVRTQVVLYLPDRLMKARIEVSDLSPYLLRVEEAVSAAATAQPTQAGASGMMLLMIKPGERSRAWIVTGEPPMKADVVTALTAAAEAVPAPKVRQGPILVGLQFDAWGGGAQPEGAVAPIPRDWYAHFSEDGGVLDDDFMAKVWPD
ncbi:hypothetical protein [Brevundimonas guildfordensis]|uniref:Uncharacterized protein n=1 Tax=Brevundimonas guildfordensis TaxID=2762241 RepID=A0ABR8R0C8_9CAUL|nr:hypothetical protein [Brevundimonas guildfordensis]MBD7941250.1 hypothetical protein [Brevundimonas guildfordensis]